MPQRSHHLSPYPTLIGLALCGLVACGGESDSASDADAGSASTGTDSKDRGAASMEIAGQPWEAEKARARLRSSGLKIDASRTGFINGNVSREQLVLMIGNFDGPGEYQAGAGSMFIGVGIDTEKAKQAATDEEIRDLGPERGQQHLPGWRHSDHHGCE